MSYSTVSFFAVHPVAPWLLLAGLALVPRFTTLVMVLFGGLASGGLLWWLGWIVSPHLLVAFLSLKYWHTDPLFVIAAWVMALTGSWGEGRTARRAARRRRREA